MTEYTKKRSTDVRYGGKNSDVLRSVLYSLYKSRCYWCTKVKEFGDIETDHIVPKHLKGQALTETLDRLGLPQHFDLNDPANLAPICRRCNGAGEKGSDDLTDAPIVVSRLKKARRLRPEVERRVREFTNRRELAAAFVTLKAADLEDADNRRIFRENLPSIARSMSAAGDDLYQMALYRFATVEVAGGEVLEAAIELETSSANAALTLETLSGVSVSVVVESPITDLWRQIHERARVAIEGADDYDTWGSSSAGPTSAESLRVDINSVELLRQGPVLEFTFSGEFDAHLSASLVRDNPYGWESSILDLQGDAAVDGSFSFTATWDARDTDAPSADEATIEECTADVWVTQSG